MTHKVNLFGIRTLLHDSISIMIFLFYNTDDEIVALVNFYVCDSLVI